VPRVEKGGAVPHHHKECAGIPDPCEVAHSQGVRKGGPREKTEPAVGHQGGGSRTKEPLRTDFV